MGMHNDGSPKSALCTCLAVAAAVCAVVLAECQFQDLHVAGIAADPYKIEKLQNSFIPLKPYVANEQMVGWLASRPVGASEMDEVEYSVARYALVPTLVCGNTDKSLIVTNFDTDDELNAVIKRDGYELVARVAPGRAVIRRRQ
jgi:hypothetical protein